MDMRSLYPISLPAGMDDGDDKQTYTDRIKKNESCLNMNFGLLAEKIYEFELRLAMLEEAQNG